MKNIKLKKIDSNSKSFNPFPPSDVISNASFLKLSFFTIFYFTIYKIYENF